MSSSTLLDLQQKRDKLCLKIGQQWDELIPKIEQREHSSELQNVIKELYDLLDECKEAGQDISDRRKRKSLQTIAREIADIIFRFTKEYPAIVILPAKSSVRGLQVLSELVSAPERQKNLSSILDISKRIIRQIELLYNYKKLHDLLHTLEFQTYIIMDQEVQNFPDNETSEYILTDCELTLQRTVDDMREVQVQLDSGVDKAFGLKELEQALAELSKALEESNQQRLQRAVLIINHVLNIQPVLINAEMTAVARSLDLDALINAMISLQEILANSASQGSIRLREDATTAATTINELGEKLRSLMAFHDKWQKLNLELRRIEANTESDLLELEVSWPYVKAQVETLYESSKDKSLLSLKRESSKLEQALAEQNLIKAKRVFQSYRKRGSYSFYQVDLELMKLLSDLQQVSAPIVYRLEVIE
ncbi:MAG: hypothetical protein QNJ54_31105 [Prochloraceae cyanobacterium]|nr:hypothetical protein [Prochloraceae cyanobacterium]